MLADQTMDRFVITATQETMNHGFAKHPHLKNVQKLVAFYAKKTLAFLLILMIFALIMDAKH